MNNSENTTGPRKFEWTTDGYFYRLSGPPTRRELVRYQTIKRHETMDAWLLTNQEGGVIAQDSSLIALTTRNNIVI